MNEHHRHESVYRFCVRCGGELALSLVKAGDPERLVCQKCGFVLYLDPKLAVGAILLKDEKLVLVQRSIEPGYGKWVFPGGYVDRGEKLEQAAIREAKEEAGIDVSIDGLVGVYSYEGAPVVIVVYSAAIVGGELRPLDESLDLMLFSRDQIPWDDLAFPSTRDALHDYCDRFWPDER